MHFLLRTLSPALGKALLSEGLATTNPVLVVGLGNPDRGDDGAGALVLEQLTGRLPGETKLHWLRDDMLALIDDWRDFNAVICVDASEPQGRAGRIRRVDCSKAPLPRDLSLTSSHALDLGTAVELAGALGLAPARLIVYAIEGAGFEAGAKIDPRVAKAAAIVANRILEEIREMRLDLRGSNAHA